jgi:pimeloyl-ACP methyl ester carboxylesterase
VDATKRVTDVVQEMHVTIASGPSLLGRPLEAPARALTGLVYGSIRGVTTAVGAGIDAVLARLGPVLGGSIPGPERAAVLAALNGVVGDYLHETGNPLAIEMCACQGGELLDLEGASPGGTLRAATGKVLVLAHGCAMNDRQWARAGHDHGAALARDLGYTPVYLRYNSGLHISTNGRSFAELLERLLEVWPVPVEGLTILGHSMGGLVARSACHVGEAEGHAWRSKLEALVCLGSPHHGSPLERGGNGIDLALGISRYSAPLARLGKLRSAGVTDLRHGSVLDEHWTGRDRFAHPGDPRAKLSLPEGVKCYVVAATLSPGPGKLRLGDGLVQVNSALGRHKRAELSLGIPEDRQWIGYGMGHLDLLARADVYERVRSWLAG